MILEKNQEAAGRRMYLATLSDADIDAKAMHTNTTLGLNLATDVDMLSYVTDLTVIGTEPADKPVFC